MYSEKVMEDFGNPRNIGEIENAAGVGEVSNPVCGDMISFYINVKDNHRTFLLQKQQLSLILLIIYKLILDSRELKICESGAHRLAGFLLDNQ